MRQEEVLLQHAIDDLPSRAKLLRLDAQSDIRVMNVAAHPDDEDGPTLTWMRQVMGWRTHVLYVTRGEGGQNETGPELGDELGALRSRECQAAAEGYGATISFLNCIDFGFSKHAEEALQQWGEQATLARLIDEIRAFDPDIVITHHTPWEGHGHHRATSILLRRACRELTQLHDPAAPAALLELTSSPDSATVAVDASDSAPGLPWSCAGRALVALRRHLSQGMGLSPIPTGPAIKRYCAVEGVGDARAIAAWAAERQPLSRDGLGRLIAPREDREAASLRATAARLEQGRTLALAAPPLLALPDGADTLRLRGPGAQAMVSVELLEPLPTGLRASAFRTGEGWGITISSSREARPTYPSERYLRVRQTVLDSVRIRLTDRTGAMEVRRIPLPDRCQRAWLQAVEPLPFLTTARDAAFLRLQLWTLPGSVAVGLPGPQRRGKDLTLAAPVPVDRVDRQISVCRPFSATGREASADRDGLIVYHGELGLLATATTPSSILLKVPCAYADTLAIRLHFVRMNPPSWRYPRTNDLPPVVPRSSKVGVIDGTDHTMGYQLQECVSIESLHHPYDLRSADLSRYPVILVDVRAYQARPDLRDDNARLLEYVRAGGHLVVCYEKDFDWQPDPNRPSPWPPLPLHVGRARVVDEDAPVTALAPNHPFFHYPNELTAADWDGWVQERGLYFPDQWDAAYTPLVRMSDAGEPPLDGGILCARVGKGAYTYTSLSWWRQLREGNPGAVRAFINLLSWPLAEPGE
jgi:LmbE family N-acetylglucosaminyl deacetylase